MASSKLVAAEEFMDLSEPAIKQTTEVQRGSRHADCDQDDSPESTKSVADLTPSHISHDKDKLQVVFINAGSDQIWS